MSIEIKLPDLGENIESGDVINIPISEGQIVEKGDTILELETDKATLDVPVEESGTISKILVSIGDSVTVGQPVVLLETSISPSENKTEQTSKEITKNEITQPSEQTIQSEEKEQNTNNTEQNKQLSPSISLVEVKLPELGDGIETADIIQVSISVGDMIEKEQDIVEVETDKATVGVPVNSSGIVKSIHVKAGDTVSIGAVLAVLETSDAMTNMDHSSESKSITESKPNLQPENAIKETPLPTNSTYTKTITPSIQTAKKLIPAAPSVRRFAREIGIDIHEVKATGPTGRITIDDVKLFAKQKNQSFTSSSFTSSFSISSKTLPDFTKFGEVERTSMNKIRKITASNMSYCWNTIPHVTQFDEADITELENLRKQHKQEVLDAGAKLTMTAILVKAVSIALKKFSNFNASIDIEQQEIIYKKYIHIGIAVDTENGLIVPVIQNVDQKNILDLSKDLTQISEKARNRKITPSDLQGGTFTISNLGGIAGTGFTPIVNWPEVAILGVSKATIKPVYINDTFVPRLKMPLSLSYDHRIIDGADAARFLHEIVTILENSFLISLNG